MGKSSTEEKVGCLVLALWGLFSVAWIAFIVWAIYTVVTWLVSK